MKSNSGTIKQSNTGAITIIRCAYCRAETPEFIAANEAREYAYAHGWKRMFRYFLCPKCAKVLDILQENSGERRYIPEDIK